MEGTEVIMPVAQERREDAHARGIGVVERQDDDPVVARPQRRGHLHRVPVFHEVAVGEHDPLGGARGPRGEDERGKVVRA